LRDNWLTVYQEMIGQGADGVCLGSDEYYYRGTYLQLLPADSPVRAAYKARYKTDIPSKMEDTLAYRRWIALRYEAQGNLFGYWSKKLKAANPKTYTCSVFMQPVSTSNLYEQGVPFDVMGKLGGIDEMGSDYMGPYDLRGQVAANGWRKATQLFSGNMYSPYKEPEINLYGSALWMLMHGGSSCGYWRYYQTFINNNTIAVKHGYEMVDDLISLGAWDARPPKHVVSFRRKPDLVREWRL